MVGFWVCQTRGEDSGFGKEESEIGIISVCSKNTNLCERLCSRRGLDCENLVHREKCLEGAFSESTAKIDRSLEQR